MGLDIGGGIMGGLTGFAAGGPAGAALGGLAGGFLGPDAPSAGAPIQFNPANITSGAGTVGFDQGTNTFTTALSGPLQAQQDQLFGIGGGFLDQLGTFDPDEFGANVSDRLRAMAAPKEEQDRLALENRLFSQGLLSSTVGSGRFGSLLDAQALAENQRVAQGFQLGQDVQGNLLSRGMSAFGAGTNLEQLPLQLLGTSLGAGRGGLGADVTNASNLLAASSLESDTSSAFLSSLLGGAGALSDIDFGSFFGGPADTTGGTEGDFFGGGFEAGGGGTF